MKIKVLTSLCAFFISGVALAECPSGLNAEKMAECITIEVASSDYQDWQKKVNLNASTKTTSGVRTDTSTEEPECD